MKIWNWTILIIIIVVIIASLIILYRKKQNKVIGYTGLAGVSFKSDVGLVKSLKISNKILSKVGSPAPYNPTKEEYEKAIQDIKDLGWIFTFPQPMGFTTIPAKLTSVKNSSVVYEAYTGKSYKAN